jgi:hypothetical protein
LTKQEIVETLESEWEALQAAIADLTEEQMTGAPVAGEWTLKDLLAHIAVWEARLVTALYKAERGVTPDLVESGPQVDQLNAQLYREQKDRPLERVLEDLHDVDISVVIRVV